MIELYTGSIIRDDRLPVLAFITSSYGFVTGPVDVLYNGHPMTYSSGDIYTDIFI